MLIAGIVLALLVPMTQAKHFYEELRVQAELSSGLRTPESATSTSLDRCENSRGWSKYLASSYVAARLPDWTLQSWPGRVFSGFACTTRTWVREAELGHLMMQPELVSLRTKGDRVLRPMLQISDFGSTYTFYDFLYDDHLEDTDVTPLVALPVADIIRATSFDPFASTEGEDVPPGPAARVPTLSVIAAACGWSSEQVRSEYGSETCFKKTGAEKLVCLRDFIVSRSDDGCSPTEISTSKTKLPEAQPDGPTIAGLLTELVKAVRSLPAPTRQETPTIIYYYSAMQSFVANGGTSGARWSDCTQLTPWSDGETPLQFSNGAAKLAGPRDNGLVIADAGQPRNSAAAWNRLQSILNHWIIELEALSIAPDAKPVLFLVGRASENGEVRYNLNLTERRASAVKSILRSPTYASRLAKVGLMDPTRAAEFPDGIAILAIGEGETALAPAEMPNTERSRRVDAYLCAGSTASVSQSAAIQN